MSVGTIPSRRQKVAATALNPAANRPDVDYVFVEYKFVGRNTGRGSSNLAQTLDGRQGSESWITGGNRIENAVGEQAAPDVWRAIDAGRYEVQVVTTRPDGSTLVEVLDAKGRPKPVDTSKILKPEINLSGAR